eukprot:scaffold494_cov117-Isochrysis_galbana.AAC.19
MKALCVRHLRGILRGHLVAARREAVRGCDRLRLGHLVIVQRRVVGMPHVAAQVALEPGSVRRLFVVLRAPSLPLAAFALVADRLRHCVPRATRAAPDRARAHRCDAVISDCHELAPLDTLSVPFGLTLSRSPRVRAQVAHTGSGHGAIAQRPATLMVVSFRQVEADLSHSVRKAAASAG